MPDDFLKHLDSFDNLELRNSEPIRDMPEIMDFGSMQDLPIMSMDMMSNIQSLDSKIMKDSIQFPNIPDIDILSPKMSKLSDDEDVVPGPGPNMNQSLSDSRFEQPSKKKIPKFRGLIVDKYTEIRSAQIRAQINNSSAILKPRESSLTQTLPNKSGMILDSVQHFSSNFHSNFNLPKFLKTTIKKILNSDLDASNCLDQSIDEFRNSFAVSMFADVAQPSIENKQLDIDLDPVENYIPPPDMDFDIPAPNCPDFEASAAHDKSDANLLREVLLESLQPVKFSKLAQNMTNREQISSLFSNLLNIASDSDGLIKLSQFSPFTEIFVSKSKN